MNSWSSYRRIITGLIICFVVTSATGLSFILVSYSVEPYPVHVRIAYIDWPISPDNMSQGETYVSFSVHMVVELWNPSKETLVHSTANSNLLDPQATLILEGGYSYIASYGALTVCTTHEIELGTTIIEPTISIQINGYNETIPPLGEYTFWVGIDNEPELYGNPPFSFKSYEIVIQQADNESVIEYEQIPRTWGSTYLPIWNLVSIPVWSLSGIELIAIVYLFVRKYRKNK